MVTALVKRRTLLRCFKMKAIIKKGKIIAYDLESDIEYNKFLDKYTKVYLGIPWYTSIDEVYIPRGGL